MQPITFYEREQIEPCLRMKKKKKWIAGKLNRDYSVIKREIKRNSGEYLSYESFPHYWFKSLTRDNGKENARHYLTFNDFKVPSYFCDPYCSWQKGGIENLNKLIRQYLPKNTDLKKINDCYRLAVQEKINNRPRKSLNYLTPNEVFVDNS